MSADTLVERLRARVRAYEESGCGAAISCGLLREAADEIERIQERDLDAWHEAKERDTKG
jgi:hypothetical protein